MKKIEQHNLILCEISRIKIEAFDFDNLLALFDAFKENPISYMGKFSFMVSGYDDDPREIYEIDEVRQYFTFLDKTFPYWLFFMNLDFPPQNSPLLLLITCLVDLEIRETRGTNKLVMLNMPQVHEFVMLHLPYFNEMMDKAGVPRSQEEQIFNKIMDHVFKSLK
jgi:hypothetical protein